MILLVRTSPQRSHSPSNSLKVINMLKVIFLLDLCSFPLSETPLFCAIQQSNRFPTTSEVNRGCQSLLKCPFSFYQNECDKDLLMLNATHGTFKDEVKLELQWFDTSTAEMYHHTKRPLDFSSGHSLASRSSIFIDSMSLELVRLAARVILVSVSS